MADLDVLLISLPWSVYERPSAATGALHAYLRRHAPRAEVTARYEYIAVARELGLDLYAAISKFAYELGELMYMPVLYPERRSHVVDHAARLFERAWREEPPAYAPGWREPGAARALVARI